MPALTKKAWLTCDYRPPIQSRPPMSLRFLVTFDEYGMVVRQHWVLGVLLFWWPFRKVKLGRTQKDMHRYFDLLQRSDGLEETEISELFDIPLDCFDSQRWNDV